jgi:hypothetical protein
MTRGTAPQMFVDGAAICVGKFAVDVRGDEIVERLAIKH